MGFLYYTHHNLNDLSAIKKKPDIGKLTPFKDSRKHNILIIQYINGIKEIEFDYSGINYQIEEYLVKELGADNVEIKIIPEKDENEINLPISDSLISDYCKKNNPSLIIQYGIKPFPNDKVILTDVKWLLPRQNTNIPIFNKKAGRVNVFNDIIEGEIMYTYKNKNISNFSVGLMHFEDKKYDLALNYFNRIIVEDTSKFYCIVKFKTALCHYFIGSAINYNEALSDFQTAMMCNINGSEIFNNVGLINYLQFENTKLAETNFQKALSLNPDLISTCNNYAVLLEKQCNGCKTPCVGCDSAIFYYHRAIQLSLTNNIEFTVPIFNIATLFQEKIDNSLNNLDSALYYYNVLLNLNNIDSIAFEIAKQNVYKLNIIKQNYFKDSAVTFKNSFGDIIISDRHLNQNNKDDINTKPDSMSNYELSENEYENGKSQLYNGNFSGAIEHLSKAISLYNPRDNFYRMRATAYFWSGQFDLALNDLENMKDTNSIMSRFMNIGNVYYSMGEHDSAIVYYKKSNSTSPNYQSTYNLGLIYFQKLDFQKAAIIFSDAMKLGGTLEVRCLRAISYSYINNKEAIVDLNNAILNYGHKAYPWFFRAKCLFMFKEYRRAINDYNKCISILENNEKKSNYNDYSVSDYSVISINEIALMHPKIFLCYEGIADIYIAKKDNKNALKYFQKSFLENRSSKYTIENIAKLLKLEGNEQESKIYFNKLDSMKKINLK